MAEVTIGASRDQERQAEAAKNPAPTPVVPSRTVRQQARPDKEAVKEKARALVAQRWGETEWPPFDAIVTAESGWNPAAKNASSGACGLPQALPCAKMGGMDVDNQLRWMVGYIASRYGTPTAAWAFWRAHRWY